MRKSAFITMTMLVASVSLSVPASGADATPKVGQCFNYSKTDLAADSPPRAAVACSSTHTAEIYRVVNWPSKTAPLKMSGDQRWTVANSVCQPWKGKKTDAQGQAITAFNYWAFYIPTQSQWSAGARWLRCDAMIATADAKGQITGYKGWKGSKLDIK